MVPAINRHFAGAIAQPQIAPMPRIRAVHEHEEGSLCSLRPEDWAKGVRVENAQRVLSVLGTKRFVEREDAFECRFRERRRQLRDVERTFEEQREVALR
jgi:hypothetical protein